ncbi:hypothetical protein H2248_006985 [Termitomyces sp. 'cryptogamus']|nr:hypothetical protein H2248_006985 [Termitomyces sp. 'cryptogamus']
MSSSSPPPVLPQGAGYGVGTFIFVHFRLTSPLSISFFLVIGMYPNSTPFYPIVTERTDAGIGLFFSVLMLMLTFLQSRYTVYSPSQSEEFSSASRSVKPGLIAAGIVSAWTWAATLLQSSAVAYRYGISGPWWYGAGAMVQVLLFAQIAAKLKLNAPNAHTWLEIVGQRWGTLAHGVFLFFGLSTNIIVSSMLVLGGSATVTDLTGMSTIAAIFLIPLGVSIYVIAGGMRATLLCDYAHTTVLLAIILTFTLTIYTTSPKIGSIRAMHNLLTAASAASPVPGNAHGSYLTMRSKNGLIFGVINLVGNFATVFNDQAYWQRAIASKPASCVKAYLLGGVAWFAIPFTFATTLGLAAVALRGDPSMRILTPADISAGLPAPAAAAALMGKSGAAAMLVLLFLAVTSATSAELIAVSSILTYDVYKRYINPQANELQILRVSHWMVAVYALIMSLAGLVFFYIGVSMGWLYTFMGVVLGSAVVPIALSITWRKANKTACITGAIVGFMAGVGVWVGVTAGLNDGVVDVVTSGGDLEMLAGNLASIGVGGVIAVGGSYLYPADFDFDITRAINAPHRLAHSSESMITKGEQAQEQAKGEHVVDNELSEDKNEELNKKEKTKIENDIDTDIESITPAGLTQDQDLDPVQLNKAFRFAAWCSIILLLVMLILIPLPLFFAQPLFSVRALEVWVVLSIIWAFGACGAVIVFPVWEARVGLGEMARGVWKDLRGGGINMR